MRQILIILLCLLWAFQADAGRTLILTTGEDTTIQEISVLVLKEAYASLGHDIDILRIPNARALHTSNAGNADGEVSRIDGIKKKFSNLIQIPVAVNYLEGVAFGRDSTLDISGWASLKKYRIVGVMGVKFVEYNYARHSIASHNVYLFTQAVRMIQSGRYDVAVFPRVNGLAAIRSIQAEEVKPIGPPLITTRLYHYLHKKNKALLPEIKTALDKMEKSGRIAQIRQQFVQDNNF